MDQEDILQNGHKDMSKLDELSDDDSSQLVKQYSTSSRVDEMEEADEDEDIDELCNIVQDFEEKSFAGKKRLNKMDRVSSQCQVIPQTLKMSIQALKRHVQNIPGEMEQTISGILKKSQDGNKNFGKFKAEFFSVNEPVINKDITTMKLTIVKSQFVKLEKLVDKLEYLESEQGSGFQDITQIQKDYLDFMTSIFGEKLEEINNTQQCTDEVLGQMENDHKDIQKDLSQAKEDAKSLVPQTKEQRVQLGEINTSIKKTDWKFKKWMTANENILKSVKKMNVQAQECSQIVDNLPAEIQEIKTLVKATKKIETLLDCRNSQKKFDPKLQSHQDELYTIQDDIKIIQDMIANYLESLKGALNDEYIDLMNEINEKKDTIDRQLEEQRERLEEFENKLEQLQLSQTDHELLNKAINKIRNEFSTIESNKDQFESNSGEIDSKMKSEPGSIISNEDLQTLRSNLKQLKKLDDYDLPKVIKSINGLEPHVIKSLKNQLNDENKKSQGMISKMKKSYEDLQKSIERCTMKYVSCLNNLTTFEDGFENEDLERRNEIESLQERVKDEGENIGGNCRRQQVDESINEGSGENQSLQRRKRLVLQKINTLVNQFNENNKLMKDSHGRHIKTEKALNELIQKNIEIKDQCQEINDIVGETKQISLDILQNLEEIVNDEILQDLVDKYKNKNENLEECDQLKEKAEKQAEEINNIVNKQTGQLEDLLNRVEIYSPMNNTANTQNQNIEFLDEITKKLEDLNQMKEEQLKMQEDIQEYCDRIERKYEPITEINEREIQFDPEIMGIKEELEQINQELLDLESDINPKTLDIAKQQKQIKEMIEKEMNRRCNIARKHLDDLDVEISDCTLLADGNQKRLKYFRDLLDKGKKLTDNDDDVLLEKLNEIQLIGDGLEKNANDNNTKVKDLKRKKAEYKKHLDEVLQSTQMIKPSQIDNLLIDLEDQHDRAFNADERLKNLDKQVDKNIKELENLLKGNTNKKECLQALQEIDTEIDDHMNNVLKLLQNLPETLQELIRTTKEMQESSKQVDDDYFDKKEELEERLDELEDIKNEFDNYEVKYNQFKAKKEQLKANSKKVQTEDALQKLKDQFNEHKNGVSDLFTDVLDSQETLEDIKNDIGDCGLTPLIEKRSRELNILTKRLDRTKQEFNNLKKSKHNDQNIDQMIKEVDFKLKIIEKEKNDHNKFQQEVLDSFNPIEFDDFLKNHEIIRKVRNQKRKLYESDQKLKDLEEVQGDIVKKLTDLDLENSTDLLSLKAQELKERLKESKIQLEKISKAGREMDGNTSNREEEEFIGAMKAEMPGIIEKVDITLSLLKDTDDLVGDVKKTSDSKKMVELQEKINISLKNVEESERLVNKLEKEIVEWNAQQKLIRRDEELEEIHKQLIDTIEDLSQEKQNTEIELDKNREKQDENRGQDMVDSEGKKVDIMKDLIKLEGQMESYFKEVSSLLDDVKKLELQKDRTMEDYNNAIPNVIQDKRKKRQSQSDVKRQSSHLKRPPQLMKNISKPSKEDSDNEEMDTYNMIKINCQFKKPIKEIRQEFKKLNKRRKDLEEKYSQMRKEVFKIKQIKLYKPVVGDVVDEMFAGYLNKAKLTIEVQRITANNYMFGSKKILAKIINGRLVIRVGGGYMNAEEFIDQYGKIEMLKMLNQEKQKNDGGFDTTDKNNFTRRSTMVPGSTAYNSQQKQFSKQDIQTKMRENLMNRLVITGVQNKGGKNTDRQSENLSSTLKRTANNKSSLGQTRGTLNPINTPAFNDNDLAEALQGLKDNYNSNQVSRTSMKVPSLQLESNLLGSPSKKGKRIAAPLSSRARSPTSANVFNSQTTGTGLKPSQSSSKIGMGFKKKNSVGLFSPRGLKKSKNNNENN